MKDHYKDDEEIRYVAGKMWRSRESERTSERVRKRKAKYKRARVK